MCEKTDEISDNTDNCQENVIMENKWLTVTLVLSNFTVNAKGVSQYFSIYKLLLWEYSLNNGWARIKKSYIPFKFKFLQCQGKWFHINILSNTGQISCLPACNVKFPWACCICIWLLHVVQFNMKHLWKMFVAIVKTCQQKYWIT